MTALVLVALLLTPVAYARWFSPQWLRWTAAKLLARADAMEQSRIVYTRSFAFYKKELRVEEAV